VHGKMQKNIKNRALEKAIKMVQEQLPLFKELVPYSGKIDLENRWIKMAETVYSGDLRSPGP